MSHFVECQTEFHHPADLVAALVECGFPEDQIEVHEQPVALYGHQGDVRRQQAHIVIRRQHVGAGANDVGGGIIQEHAKPEARVPPRAGQADRQAAR